MGRDKAFLPFGGGALLDAVHDALAPQVDQTVVAAGQPERAKDFNARYVLCWDGPYAGDGPLAGLRAGMEWALQREPHAAWVATVPVDTPFLPASFVEELKRAAVREGASIALAQSGERTHYLCGLWHVTLRPALEEFMAQGGRKAESFVQAHGFAAACWSIAPRDPFLNLNAPHDYERALNAARAAALHPSFTDS